MRSGSLCMTIAFVLFVLLGVGIPMFPRADMFAFAAMALGLLLGGSFLPPWPR